MGIVRRIATCSLALIAACERPTTVERRASPDRPAPLGSTPLIGRDVITSLPRIGYRLPPAEERTRLLAAVAARQRVPTSGALALAAASNNYFVQFLRMTAEDTTWWTMQGDSAYYRDVYMGAETYVSSAQNGDYWVVRATSPTGRVTDYGRISFHASYNGETDCFVASGFGGWRLCGGDGGWFQWYQTSQCGETGVWTFEFYANGAMYDRRQFTLKPKVEDWRVPYLNQANGDWATTEYDHSCTRVVQVPQSDGTTKTLRFSVRCPDGDADHHTIRQKGCAISSAAMVLGYHRLPTTPPTLNGWLRAASDGYSGAGNTWFGAVGRYGLQRLREAGREGDFGYDRRYMQVTDWNTLRDLICRFGPQVIAVRGTGHFVAAVGFTDDYRDIILHDPAGGVLTTLNTRYNGRFNGIRLLTGPQKTVTDTRGVTIRFFSPVEAFVTDPLGRSAGLDARSGTTYAEIPDAAYLHTSTDDDEDTPLAAIPEEKTIELVVPAPPDGLYHVTVVGTAIGTYRMEMLLEGPGGTAAQTTFDPVPTAPGMVHQYAFSYAAAGVTPGAVTLRGGFQGGGQRDEVDDLLTYGAPVERSTTLPAGTTSYTLLAYVGTPLVAGTLEATLNGVDITPQFRGVGLNAISLPLAQGRNVLKLSARGTFGTRTSTDQDQMVFIVP